jgi:hypothetical protein
MDRVSLERLASFPLIRCPDESVTTRDAPVLTFGLDAISANVVAGSPAAGVACARAALGSKATASTRTPKG